MPLNVYMKRCMKNKQLQFQALKIYESSPSLFFLSFMLLQIATDAALSDIRAAILLLLFTDQIWIRLVLVRID